MVDSSLKDTIWNSTVLEGPPLNISAFYLPFGNFHYDYVLGPWASDNSSVSMFNDKNRVRFLLDDKIFDIPTLQESGSCQPIRNVSFKVPRYLCALFAPPRPS